MKPKFRKSGNHGEKTLAGGKSVFSLSYQQKRRFEMAEANVICLLTTQAANSSGAEPLLLTTYILTTRTRT
jgi:hypothetical protein